MTIFIRFNSIVSVSIINYFIIHTFDDLSSSVICLVYFRLRRAGTVNFANVESPFLVNESDKWFLVALHRW